MTVRWLTMDVFDGLATLDDGSVDLVICSPPFLALRSYLPADHPDKAKEIGSEPTPAAFIDVLLAVTAELRRVLAPHGSICVELGDTYAGSGGPSGDSRGIGLLSASREGQMPASVNHLGEGWPLAKSKTLIPELYRLALAYGINPLTGQPSPAGRWRVRNVVTWCRPNPPVGALGDKWRPATSDIVVACVSDRRYWDDIATRREHRSDPADMGKTMGHFRETTGLAGGDARGNGFHTGGNAAGAPLLDYWELPPGGYPGSHYAVYPPALVEPLIKAMAPPRVCRTCGEPSRRIVALDGESETRFISAAVEAKEAARIEGTISPHGRVQAPRDRAGERSNTSRATTKGWSSCSHDNWRPAHILDCFGGSGTTGVVATGHGHDVTLIDLDERNADLARERIGPLLFDEVTA